MSKIQIISTQWSKEEALQVFYYIKEGYSIGQIASIMGRTKQSIYSKIAKGHYKVKAVKKMLVKDKVSPEEVYDMIWGKDYIFPALITPTTIPTINISKVSSNGGGGGSLRRTTITLAKSSSALQQHIDSKISELSKKIEKLKELRAEI